MAMVVGDCTVSGCSNRIGANFPKDITLRNAWRRSLGLQRSQINNDSFVCADHFSSDDIEYKSRHGVRVKEGAVPELRPNRARDNTRKCRICLTDRNLGRSLTDFVDINTTVMEAIRELAAPVQIDHLDSYPNRICKHCYLNLRGAHKFRARLLKSNAALNDSFNKKRKCDEVIVSSSPEIKKICVSPVKKEEVPEPPQQVCIRDLNIANEDLEVVYETECKSSNRIVDDIERTLEEIHGDSGENVEEEHYDIEDVVETVERDDSEHEQVDIRNLLATLPKGLSIKPVAGDTKTEKLKKMLTGERKNAMKITAKIKYMSETGYFTFRIRKGLFNVAFFEADDYLYELGLIKNGERDKEIRAIVPLKNVINEIFRNQSVPKCPQLETFEDFYNRIEDEVYSTLHFTINQQQFYQERFAVESEGSLAIVFGNKEFGKQIAHSKVLYVDASFKIDTTDKFKYQLVSVLAWVDESYYPVAFALINQKSQELFRMIFSYIRGNLAPELRPKEIVTDYEANLYYALAETYIGTNIGGSVFYYVQNLYKKACSLNLSREMESNSCFRNIYHMLLMLPLLPVNTIHDALNTIEAEAGGAGLTNLARPLIDHLRNEWILQVTPELFCVHKLESRINENVIAPFKKLRDYLLLTKGKYQRNATDITHVIAKLIDVENFLRVAFATTENKKSFGRDLTSFQKRIVLRAWQFIDDHPKIEINSFFTKVLGYIRCMENQLWIWGFYRYEGAADDILINATHFSIVCPDEDEEEEADEEVYATYAESGETASNAVVVEAVIDQNGVLQDVENGVVADKVVAKKTKKDNVVVTSLPQPFENAYLKYVYQ